MPSPCHVPVPFTGSPEPLFRAPTPEEIGKCIEATPKAHWYPSGPYYDEDRRKPLSSPLPWPSRQDVEGVLEILLERNKIDPISAHTISNAYPATQAFMHYVCAAALKYDDYCICLQHGDRTLWDDRLTRFDKLCASAVKGALQVPSDSISRQQLDFIKAEQELSQWVFESNKDALGRVVERNLAYLNKSLPKQIGAATAITDGVERQQRYKSIIDNAMAQHIDIRYPSRCFHGDVKALGTFCAAQKQFVGTMNTCWAKIRAEAVLKTLQEGPMEVASQVEQWKGSEDGSDADGGVAV